MTNEIAERLVTLRKFLNLNQGQFSEPLGLSSATISSIELGKSQLTEQTIRLICLTFNINETWLRTGSGTMFNKYSSGTGSGTMFNEYSPWEQNLLEKFRKVPPDMQKHILDYVDLLLKGQSQTATEKQTD